MGDREEGELSEEGELPVDEAAEEAPAAAAAQPDAATAASSPPAAAAAAAADGAPQQQQQEQQQQAGQPQQQQAGQPQQQQEQQPPPGSSTLSRPRSAQQQQPLARGGSSSGGPAGRTTPLGRPGSASSARSGGSGGRGSGGTSAERPPAVSERETAELARELERLTASLSFQELRNNWVTSCQNIKAAIKKQDKLLRRIKRRREDDVAAYPPQAEVSARIAAALKHVMVLCGTGQCKLAGDMDVAANLMRAAVNYRHDVFSLAQKRELEQQIRDSKEFQYLFTDRDKGKAGGSAQQPPQQQQQQAGGGGSDAAAGEAGQPAPTAPAAAPPAAAAAAGEPDQAGAAAAAGAGGATPTPAGTAAAASKGGPPIRIVVHSTGLNAGSKRPLGAEGAAAAADDGDAAAGAKRARRDEQLANGGGGVPPWESEEYKAAAAGINGSPVKEVMSRLLSARRLILVLDLDHTLVNSIKFGEVDPAWDVKLEQLAAEQLPRPREARDLHRMARLGMWTKLRPGVREFLRRAAARFELWIYTAGSRPYAEAMAELLDPTGQYFGPRIIAQGAPAGAGAPDESFGAPAAPAVGEHQPVVKRLLQGLEGCEPVVLIVDDSSAVWPGHRRNLFVVERYVYFPSPASSSQRGPGRSLLEVDRDECPRRGMLMAALRVFEHLHDLVFARLDDAPLVNHPDAAAGWDVRNVVAGEKQHVLAGVRLVFSRVIPLEADPRQHPLWQLAEQYGATCSEQCGDATTHVVASHAGTEKAIWARSNNKFVVGPAWLECSCILWQRAAEERFPPPT